MPRSWSLTLALAAGLLLLTIGILVLHPIYFNVCEAAQYGTKQKCELHDALYVAVLNAWDTIFHAEFWTALATIAIAAFTLTLKWSTDRLWTAGERQLAHFEDTAERQLRAYIFPRHTKLIDFNSNPLVQIIFKNSGQTPAYDTALWATVAVAAYPLENEPERPSGLGTES